MNYLKIIPDNVLEFSVSDSGSALVILQLENISDNEIAYKIKTTAPKNYIVRPCSGILQLNGTQEIQIVLQSISKDLFSPKDRFLIQATLFDSNVQVLSKLFWNSLSSENIQEHRLGVYFKEYNQFNTNNRNSLLMTSSTENSNIRETMTSNLKPLSPTNKSTELLAPNNSLSLEFENKYNDLLQYCIAIESQKKALAAELQESLVKLSLINEKPNINTVCHHCGSSLTESTDSIEKPKTRNKTLHVHEVWIIPLVVILCLCFLKYINVL